MAPLGPFYATLPYLSGYLLGGLHRGEMPLRIDSIPLHGHLTIRCCPNNKIRHITTTLHCDGNLTHSTYAFKTQAYDIARMLSHNLCPAHTAAHCAAPIVIISHNGQYSLKYMHFSRWGMRSMISERVCELSVLFLHGTKPLSLTHSNSAHFGVPGSRVLHGLWGGPREMMTMSHSAQMNRSSVSYPDISYIQVEK
jgi:hypothetical protein